MRVASLLAVFLFPPRLLLHDSYTSPGTAQRDAGPDWIRNSSPESVQVMGGNSKSCASQKSAVQLCSMQCSIFGSERKRAQSTILLLGWFSLLCSSWDGEVLICQYTTRYILIEWTAKFLPSQSTTRPVLLARDPLITLIDRCLWYEVVVPGGLRLTQCGREKLVLNPLAKVIILNASSASE